MRTKTLVSGFKNSQKIRLIINGFGVYTTINDVFFNLFATVSHRYAAECALYALSQMRAGSGAAEQCVSGLCATYNGHQVQLDLI